MLERARNLNRSIENISWVQGNGSDLSNIASASVQFVFSYLAPLQHLPAENLVHSYVRESSAFSAMAVSARFNSTEARKPHELAGRLAWSVIDSLWAMRLSGASRFIANSLGMDPEMGRATAGTAWV